MRQTIRLWLIAGALAVITGAAAPAAAENGFYIGGSVGRSTLEITDFNLDVDDFDFSADTTSYKIIVGYRLLGFFAVEGSWVDFGTLSDSAVDIEDGTVRVDADLKVLDAFAVGMIPLGFADVFAKVGIASWDADYRALIDGLPGSDSGSGTDMVYGIGGQLRFQGFAARLEVEYFSVAEADNLYLVSLGATYTF